MTSPSEEQTKSTGVKHDSDKPNLSLIPSSLLLEVGRVLTYGAEKYSAHNWRSGITQSRLMSAAMRHIIAYNEGEDLDEESGLHHLAHAICELSFAMEHTLNPEQYGSFDDRYRFSEYKSGNKIGDKK